MVEIFQDLNPWVQGLTLIILGVPMIFVGIAVGYVVIAAVIMIVVTAFSVMLVSGVTVTERLVDATFSGLRWIGDQFRKLKLRNESKRGKHE